MLKMKIDSAIALSAICLLVGTTSVYAKLADNKAHDNFVKVKTEEGIGISITDDDGNMKRSYSLDGGKTWNEGKPLSDLPPVKWKDITVEDLLNTIEETKANMADPDFMSDWARMGKTKQDLLDYIDKLENDIERLKKGVVLKKGKIENADGTFDYMAVSHDPSLVKTMTEKCSIVTYIDEETGKEFRYEAETPEELCSIVEQAYTSGEITKEIRDEMLAEIKINTEG